jgi:xanthine dehydrogenase accessory factor
MDFSTIEALNAARRERRAVVHLVDLQSGSSRVIQEGEVVEGIVGQAIASTFRSGTARSVEADGRTFFLNPYLPPVRIVTIGAVHISQVLASMAALSGFDIRIIDPRTAFATPERFAGVDMIADWPVDVLAERPLDRYSALVAVTHDPKIDDYPIGAALKAGCFYVGALGSRKTHAARLERLRKEGFGEDELARVHAPIGFDIGASGPAEIAVSILAEIIQALRQPEHAALGERHP